jgi:hypothetical protein
MERDTLNPDDYDYQIVLQVKDNILRVMATANLELNQVQDLLRQALNEMDKTIDSTPPTYLQ